MWALEIIDKKMILISKIFNNGSMIRGTPDDADISCYLLAAGGLKILFGGRDLHERLAKIGGGWWNGGCGPL